MEWRLEMYVDPKNGSVPGGVPFERLYNPGDRMIVYGKHLCLYNVQQSALYFAKRHGWKIKTRTDSIKKELLILRIS